MARRMSREVAVDEGGYVPRMVGLMCRRVDMRERGQQEGQHEREGRNNRGGRTHDVSIARASKMVNLLCVWTQGSYMEELAANCRSSNYAGNPALMRTYCAEWRANTTRRWGGYENRFPLSKWLSLSTPWRMVRPIPPANLERGRLQQPQPPLQTFGTFQRLSQYF